MKTARRVLAVATPVLALATAIASATMPAAPTGARTATGVVCPTGTSEAPTGRGNAARPSSPTSLSPRIQARELTVPVPVERCRLAGAVVTLGSLTVRMPGADGESVTASAITDHHGRTTLTVARAGGMATAAVTATDPSTPEDPASPSDGPPPRAQAGADVEGGPRGSNPEDVESDARCRDAAGVWLGTRWRGTYRWSLNPASVPIYLGPVNDVRAAVRAAATALDDGRNDCGLPNRLGLSQQFAGDTDRDAGVRRDATCGKPDRHNVIAFGDLDGGLLALTCLWWSHGRTSEADVRISQTTGLFTLDPSPGCADQWDLQGTLTHEFGHVFGLGHVPFAEHGDLTMSDGLPGCTTRFRTLGLGDYQTLRTAYGG